MIPGYMRILRRQIDASFSENDLQNLAFDLNIDWEHLHRGTKLEIIRSLISYLLQRGRLADLITLLRDERPGGVWANPPPKEQQLKDSQTYVSESERRKLFGDLLKEIGPLVTGVIQMKPQIEAKIDYLDPSQMATLIRFLAAANLASYINFSGVSLEGQDLIGLNLQGIDLSKANLRWTKLTGCNLKNANLLRADMYNTLLHEVNLTGSNVKFNQLEQVNHDSELIMPNGKTFGDGGDFL